MKKPARYGHCQRILKIRVKPALPGQIQPNGTFEGHSNFSIWARSEPLLRTFNFSFKTLHLFLHSGLRYKNGTGDRCSNFSTLTRFRSWIISPGSGSFTWSHGSVSQRKIESPRRIRGKFNAHVEWHGHRFQRSQSILMNSDARALKSESFRELQSASESFTAVLL